jgi:hypothetical protein
LTTTCLAQNTPSADEDFHIFTDAPRVLLNKAKLRRVQREAERKSMRWEQFDTLVAGGVPMPEPGFAYALYYRASGTLAAGRKAVDWALSNEATDLRQLAMVFDWCGPVMTAQQSERLAAKIQAQLAKAPDSQSDVRTQAARALAATAIADRLPDQGASILSAIVQQWWRGTIVPTLAPGEPSVTRIAPGEPAVPRLARVEPAIPRDQVFALYELMHVLRDNLKIDLRESAEEFFKQLPMDHLTGQYPAPFASSEGLFHVPVYVRDGEPDVRDAALARAAEMAMVAYDNNSADSQYLQGWLTQDRFQMQDPFGSPYEFLWADPYQPGLSFFQVPLVFHDANTGHLFARASWDEDAPWIGYFEGHLQRYQNDQIETLKPGAAVAPIRVGDAVIMSVPAKEAAKFHIDSTLLFVLSLEPRSIYDLEIDDEGLDEVRTDAGGTLVINVPEGTEANARIRLRKDLK